MNLLLDTHAFLWSATNDPRLTEEDDGAAGLQRAVMHHLDDVRPAHAREHRLNHTLA